MEAYDRKINLKLIDQLRHLEKVSLDHYIENVLMPLQETNPSFYYTLHKDILFVIKDFDSDENKEENDIQENTVKYQTRLHDISIWLHLELIKQLNIESLELNEIPKRNEYGIKKYLDFDAILDVIKIKPNIMGIELDINGFIDKLRNK